MITPVTQRGCDLVLTFITMRERAPSNPISSMWDGELVIVNHGVLIGSAESAG